MRTEGLLSALAAVLLTSACATVSPIPTVATALPDLAATTAAAATTRSPATEAVAFPAPQTEPITGDLPGFASLLKSDFQQIATAPLRWERSDWLKLGIGLAVVGGVALIDHDLRESADKGKTPMSRTLAKVVEPFGAEYSFGVLGGFFLAGKLFDDEKSMAVAEDGLAASAIAAGAITPLLKVALGRRRPSETRGTVEFGEGGVSFPSGHATQAFAIASVVASHYDSIWVKVGAYSLAGLVGWSRMHDKAHYASDVVAGALIGIVVGNAVVRLHEGPRFRISASPSVNPRSAGVALTFGTSLGEVLGVFR